MSVIGDAFQKARRSYSAWERGVLSKLGPVGRWWQRRIDRQLSEPDWKQLNRIWLGITVLAFVVGCLVAGKYYEYQCNKHIVESFYPEQACLLGLKCDPSQVLYHTGNKSLDDVPLLGRDLVSPRQVHYEGGGD